jgi:hypothetical protein
VLPWNLRQFISYFFALIIYSINLLKTDEYSLLTSTARVVLPVISIDLVDEYSLLTSTARVVLPVRSLDLVDEYSFFTEN